MASAATALLLRRYAARCRCRVHRPYHFAAFRLALHCASRKHDHRQLQRSFLTDLGRGANKQTRQAELGVPAAATSSRFSGVGAEQVHPTPLDTEGESANNYKTLEIPAHTKLRMIVEANGINISRPKILNLMSPGKRPKPNFCNHGVTALISNSAKKTTMSQRVMKRLTARKCGHLVQSPSAPTRSCQKPPL